MHLRISVRKCKVYRFTGLQGLQKFNIGKETGRKEDPLRIAKNMRTVSKVNGSNIFDRTEWLSTGQIRGFFWRLSANVKQGHQTWRERVENDAESTDTEEDEDLVEACNADKECLTETREAFLVKTDLAHPTVYNIYDLCSFAREEELS